MTVILKSLLHKEIEQLAFKLLDLRRDIIRNPKFKVEFLDPLEKKLKLNEKK
jgi:hypothetical protein